MILVDEYTMIAVVEIIFLLCLLIWYLYIRKRRLESVTEGTIQLNEEHITSSLHPLDYINREINKTVRKISYLNKQENRDQEKINKCNFRLKLLETEKLFFTMVGVDEDKFWTMFFQDFPSENNKAELLTNFVNKEKHEIALRQIELYKRESKNLQKYKKLFFQLKDKFIELDKNKDNLLEHIKNNVPEYSQDEELVRLVNELQKDKMDLQNKLAFIEQEFETLLQNNLQIESSSNEYAAEEDISAMGLADRVQSITRIVTKQKLEIEELNNIIDQMEMEVEAKEVFAKKVEELHRSQKEMANVITILEHENEFLRKQHEMLLSSAEHGGDPNELKNELRQKDSEILKLKEKYTKLEAQYLEVFEKKMLNG